jgi:IPT/TIG domain
MRTGLHHKVAVGVAAATTTVLLTATPALAATITSFAPSSGLPDMPGVCPGGVIIINGTGFVTDNATGASFNGVPATYFVVGSNVIAYTRVPAGATDGKITITTSAGPVTSATDFDVLTCWSATEKDIGHSTAPIAISSFKPTAAKRGATVTITGNSLMGATAVRFGGIPATFSAVSETKITAKVPALAKSGKISVTGPSGTVRSSASFTVK